MSVTHLMARAARSVVTVVVFILALHLMLTAHGQTDNTVTCDVPLVEPLARTSVTCHFPENVSQTRTLVTVSFYKGAQYTASNEQTILDCWWLSGRMDCDVQPGYKFNRMISHELTLEIPRVSTKDIGGYACKLSNMNPKDVKPCELKIKLEGKTMCDVPSVPLNSRTSLTCYFPEDLSKNTADFSVYHQSSRSDSVNVMSCKRIGNHRSCNTIGGYEFDQTVTNHLTVGIPTAQEDQEGSYSCHYTSSSPVRYENCSFTFTKGKNVTCAVSTVEPLASTSLKCYFPEDVTQTKRDFSVYRYKEERVPQNILDCWWRSGKVQCYVSPGYKLTSVLRHIATLEIPRATVEHIGTYMCLLDSYKINNSKTCEFGLKLAGKTMCDIPLVSNKSQPLLTCYFPEDIRKTRTGFTVYHYTSREDKSINLFVIDCDWEQDNLVCTTARGYVFEHNVADHVTLKITIPSENYEGTYNCQMKGDGIVRSETCSFMLLRETTSSCYVPSVHEGYPSTLTCKFSADVNKNKRNVEVVHINKGGKAVIILTCTWRNNLLVCAIAAGYEFSNTISDHLVITIPRASRDHNGHYACHVLGSELHWFKQCPFIVVRDEDTNFPVITIAITAAIVIIVVLIPIGITRVVYILRKGVSKKVPSEETSVISPKESQTRGESEEEFWEKWVEAAFPALDTDFYFLPPVPVNLQPFRQTDESNQTATTPVQDSDVRHDAAIQRVLLCLEKMFKSNKEVVVGVSKFSFDYYLRESRYADAIGKLPLPTRHQSDQQQKWKQGDIDILLIHRQLGLVICMISDFDGDDKNNLQEAIEQLDSAERMLYNLVSDIDPYLNVTKTIAFPNLTFDHLQRILETDSELTKRLGECLTEIGRYRIARVCLCCDQLSDSKTPRDVSSDVRKKIRRWWKHVTEFGATAYMTPGVYKKLVARLCGPATTVSVPCTCPPRVSVKTLGQAVSHRGQWYTAVITLFPEQVHLLHTAPPTLFVTGPPGTGKTVVLLLMAIQWLRCGHHVYVVSTWSGSRAACSMLYHLLLQTVNTQQSAGVSPGQPHLLLYHLDGGKDVEKAVNDLSQAASGESLYVIADEVGSYRLEFFCSKLLTQVPRLHLWAASCFHEDAPAGWQVEHLTRPLRSPLVVVREVEQDEWITRNRNVLPYSGRGVSDHTDGPPVRRLYHQRDQGHSGYFPGDCVTCGREVASFLHSLRVDVTESGTATSATVTSSSGGTTPPCLQWRDVLVLHQVDVSVNSGVVKGLQEAGIPVEVMKDDDIEDVATARSDVVWVAYGYHVRGLERKVVVCLMGHNPDSYSFDRLDHMSCCTSQLVIVSPDYN